MRVPFTLARSDSYVFRHSPTFPDLEAGLGPLLPSSSSPSRRRRRSASFLLRRLTLCGMPLHRLQKNNVLLVLLILLLSFLLLVVARRSGGLFTSSGAASTFLTTHPSPLRSSYPYDGLRNLVMVAGHSVYTSTRCGSVMSEDSWFLEPYQRLQGQAATFVEHIRAGVEKAAQDPAALLLFSGGQTRRAAGPRTEAQSYWGLAEGAGWFDHPEVMERALTEENARDSFENVLFSICRFRELTGVYPENITVVSYDFKEKRFGELHRSALGFPRNRFLFVGTPGVPAGQRNAKLGEEKTRQLFERDPYGCNGVLSEKRLLRDPFARSLPYPQGCPEIQQLFLHCGTELYSGSLPWR